MFQQAIQSATQGDGALVDLGRVVSEIGARALDDAGVGARLFALGGVTTTDTTGLVDANGADADLCYACDLVPTVMASVRRGAAQQLLNVHVHRGAFRGGGEVLSWMV